MYLVFYVFFPFNDQFHFFVLASVVVNQKARTEADVMSKIEIDSILKYAPDKIGAWDRGKIYDKYKLDCILWCNSTILVETISREFYGICLKSFTDSAKNCYTCSWMQARGIAF